MSCVEVACGKNTLGTPMNRPNKKCIHYIIIAYKSLCNNIIVGLSAFISESANVLFSFINS